MSDTGPTSGKMGIKIEPPKTLTGKDMPKDWPQITTDIGPRFKGFDPERDFAMDTFSFNLKAGDKELCYLAADHSQDPNHPQMEVLRKRFNEFKPVAVLFEGQEGSSFTIKTEAEAIAAGGEVGLLMYLATQHNENLQPGEKPISIIAGDIPYADWVVEFQKLGYSNDDIAVFDLARKIHSTASYLNNNTELSAEEKAHQLQEAEAKFKADPESFIFPGLPRADSQKWTPELLAQDVQRIAGRDISMELSTQNVPHLTKMFNDETVFRDTYQAKKIEETARGHDKVLAMAGSAHLLRQEVALRQLFT